MLININYGEYMSAIDTLSHVHVGFFCDLPIYWIIESGKLSNITVELPRSKV